MDENIPNQPIVQKKKEELKYQGLNRSASGKIDINSYFGDKGALSTPQKNTSNYSKSSQNQSSSPQNQNSSVQNMSQQNQASSQQNQASSQQNQASSQQNQASSQQNQISSAQSFSSQSNPAQNISSQDAQNQKTTFSSGSENSRPIDFQSVNYRLNDLIQKSSPKIKVSSAKQTASSQPAFPTQQSSSSQQGASALESPYLKQAPKGQELFIQSPILRQTSNQAQADFQKQSSFSQQLNTLSSSQNVYPTSKKSSVIHSGAVSNQEDRFWESRPLDTKKAVQGISRGILVVTFLSVALVILFVAVYYGVFLAKDSFSQGSAQKSISNLRVYFNDINIPQSNSAIAFILEKEKEAGFSDADYFEKKLNSINLEDKPDEKRYALSMVTNISPLSLAIARGWLGKYDSSSKKYLLDINRQRLLIILDSNAIQKQIFNQISDANDVIDSNKISELFRSNLYEFSPRFIEESKIHAVEYLNEYLSFKQDSIKEAVVADDFVAAAVLSDQVVAIVNVYAE